MKNEKKNKVITGVLLIILVFFLDRITKVLILNIANETGKVDIYLNSFINLYLVWNRGIGFGLFSFDQENLYNLITILLIVINLIIIYLVFIEKGSKTYFLILILGGSLGNLFDRLFYRAVPDFIDLNFNGYHWFIFNVADIFITIGILCLILAEIINYKKVPNDKTN